MEWAKAGIDLKDLRALGIDLKPDMALLRELEGDEFPEESHELTKDDLAAIQDELRALGGHQDLEEEDLHLEEDPELVQKRLDEIQVEIRRLEDLVEKLRKSKKKEELEQAKLELDSLREESSMLQEELLVLSVKSKEHVDFGEKLGDEDEKHMLIERFREIPGEMKALSAKIEELRKSGKKAQLEEAMMELETLRDELDMIKEELGSETVASLASSKARKDADIPDILTMQKEAVAFKLAGDIEGAKAVMRKIKEIQAANATDADHQDSGPSDAPMEAEISRLKQEAVRLKREGDIEGAKAILLKIKSMSSQSKDPGINSAKSSEPLTLIETPSVAQSGSSQQLLKRQIAELMAKARELKNQGRVEESKATVLEIKRLKAEMDSAVVEEKQQPTRTQSVCAPSQADEIVDLEKRIKLTKREAVRLKNEGDLKGAKSYVTQYKELQQRLDDLKSSRSDLAQTAEKLVLDGVVDAKRMAEYNVIFSKLEKQIQELQKMTKLSSSLTTKGTRKSLGKEEQATIDLAEKANLLLTRSRVTVQTVQESYKLGNPAPLFHLETFSYVKEWTNPDISRESMVVILDSCQDLIPVSGSKLSCYAVIEYTYGTDKQSQTRRSSTVSGVSPSFNFSCRFDIGSRTKIGKGFKFAKLTVKLYSPGFLFGETLVGECTIKLAPLMGKCDIDETFKLKKDGKSAGSVVMRISLHSPIETPEFREIKTELLVVDTVIAAALSAPSPASPAPQSHSRENSESKKSSVTEEARIISEASGNVPDGIEPEDWKDPSNLNLLASVDLLHNEYDALESQIANGKSAGQAIAALEQRQADVHTKMDELAAKLDSGIEEYFAHLQEQVLYQEKLVKALVAAKRKEEAKVVLARVKLMKKEMESGSPQVSPGLSDRISEKKTSIPTSVEIKKDAGAPPPGINEEDWKSPSNLNLLVSVEVLEKELERVGVEIAKTKLSGRDVPAALQDLYNKLQLKIMMLQEQVESGQLTLAQYIESLTSSCARHDKLAKALSQSGRKEEAKTVLLRSKMMKQEIAQAASM